MNNAPSDFETMQNDIARILRETAVLSDLTIIPEQKQDLLNEIDIALGQIGMAVIVQTLNMTVKHPELPGPHFDALGLSVVVNENVLINRNTTDRTALRVAHEISKALHQKRIAGAPGPILCTGIFFQPNPSILIYSVDFIMGEQ